MKFHSAISELESTTNAVDAIVRDLRGQLSQIDAAWVFFTREHASSAADELIQHIWRELRPRVMIGCSAEGVIGGDLEIERRAGISVLAGELPNAHLHPVHVGADDWRRLLSDGDGFRDQLGFADDTRAMIGFGDPWTTPLNQFMHALDSLAPNAPLIGGMASAAQREGQNVLVCNDEIFNDGFVGMTIGGAVKVQTVVSQGARPIGQPMVITKGHDNVIEQVGGKPVFSVLQQLFESLSPPEQTLLEEGLLIGRAMSEYRDKFGRGDFVIRNVIGAQQGALAITEHIRVGQTVQFHVRDAQTADQDLRRLLEQSHESGLPAGALLFSCNGRGTRMFDQPNHDIALARETMTNTPTAGFFAAGEIGPVGAKNFIHGHTASFALLRPA